MKISPITAVVVTPAILVALHFGPGLRWLQSDDSAQLARAADRLARQQNWDEAAKSYTAALDALPENSDTQRRALEIELGRSLVMSGSIFEGQERLQDTLIELEEQGMERSAAAVAARADLASASYLAAWLMRLEGGNAEEWMPEAERARQQFRFLAESSATLPGISTGLAAVLSEPQSNADTDAFQKNLEATVRLQQMDLSELLARPLPKNCPNCKNGLCQRKRKQQCAGQKPGDGKKKGNKKQESDRGKGPQDARQDIKKTNGAGLFDGGLGGS